MSHARGVRAGVASTVTWVSSYGSSVVALVLAAAALTKLFRRDRLIFLVYHYRIVPMPAARWIARVLPETELVLAALLLGRVSVTYASIAASGLFALFAGAIALNLLRGRSDIPCGCFGANDSSRIGWGHVARNAVLGSVAFASAWWPGEPVAALSDDHVSSVAAAAVTLTCWWLAGVAARMWRDVDPDAALAAGPAVTGSMEVR